MLTVPEALRLNARRFPGAVAVSGPDGQRSYADLAARAWALARGLAHAGVCPGDTVGVLTGNGVFAAETYLGVVAAGAIAVPFNWRWATPELVFAVDDARVGVVRVEEPWADAYEEAATTSELERVHTVVRQGPAYESFLRSGPAPPLGVDEQAGNVVLYTGGTTGFPKGVLLTHRNVMANALNEIVDTAMEHRDTTLLITPMFHSASLLCWFLPHLVLGARSVFLRTFDEELVADTMAREGITNGFLVPSMLRRLLRAGVLCCTRLRDYRRMYVGAAAFRMPDKEEVRATLPDARLYYQYGLTEAGPIVTRLLPEDMERRDVDGSIGQEFLLAEVSVRDPHGQEVAAGNVGELCIRGPGVMAGYLHRPAETRAVLREGWLHSGDLVTRDDEGFLYFRDRAKDMIKTGGENVYSAEVEQALYGHEAVAEAAVIGVPSAEWDEEVRAMVIVKPGHRVDERQLQAYLRGLLAGYKVPKRIALVGLESLPVNPSGKIVKRRLRASAVWDDVPE